MLQRRRCTLKSSAARVAVLAFILAGASPLVAGKPPGAPSWDPSAAAQYLDAQMDAWWTNAKPLKTEDSEARCLSCHTAVPYVLARAALGRSAGQALPTANEQRIADTAKLRVDLADRSQPFYDNSEDKKRNREGPSMARQQARSTTDPEWAPWRAHALNYDREHGGPKGEAWRRMFMCDLATGLAALGLTE
jgi:hypothetical protein